MGDFQSFSFSYQTKYSGMVYNKEINEYNEQDYWKCRTQKVKQQQK